MENISLSGKLNFIEFADLLQLIGNNGSTGILKVKNPLATGPATVYIEKGNPVNASQGNLSGLEALFAIFGWTDIGEFQFIEKTVPVKKLIKKNRMEIILEGLRLLDDGKIPILSSTPKQKTDSQKRQHPSGIPTIKGPLIDYIYIADEETFRDGDKIVEEGKFGSWMWVILEGIFRIVKETPNGPMDLLRISEGSFVGNISTFLARQHVRGASAIAEGMVQLGVVDSQRLSNEFSAMSKKFRELLIGFDHRLGQVSSHTMRIRLNQPVLLELQEEYEPLANLEDTDTEDDDSFIYDDENAYIIREGRAAIVRNIGGVDVIIAELSPGDFIGRIPFLNTGHEPYSANIYRTSDLKLSLVDIDPLQKEYDRLSVTFKNIIENISSSISATTQVATDFFNQNFKSSS